MQFGFMKGRSTTQAIEKVMDIVNSAGTGQLYNHKLCVLASLDVANAFNSVPWDKIDASLGSKKFPCHILRCIND